MSVTPVVWLVSVVGQFTWHMKFRGMLHKRLALNTQKCLKERKFSMTVQQFYV